MPDWEKVIEGLECCTQHGRMCGRDCSGHWGWTDDSHTGMELLGEYRTKCPYGNCETGCVKTLTKDALALLKAQESRVMALEEALGTEVNVDQCWLEVAGIQTVYLADAVVCPEHLERADIQRWGASDCQLPIDLYGKCWRCWTSKPTDEQRKAVKWDA